MKHALPFVWALFMLCGLLFCTLIIPAWTGSQIAQVGCGFGLLGMCAFGYLMDKLEAQL